MGGGRVNHPGIGVIDEPHRLHCRRVRQAEKDDIRPVEVLLSLCKVFSLVIIYQQEIDVPPAGQAVVDLKAGGALPAVNIHIGFHASLASINA